MNTRFLEMIDHIGWFMLGLMVGIMLFNPASAIVSFVGCIGLVLVEYLNNRLIQLEIASHWNELERKIDD